MTPETQKSLTEHEIKVRTLILQLEGIVQGFPDTMNKLNNVARAWARFISLQPHKLKLNPAIAEFMTDDEKKALSWKDGVIPGEWLINKISDSCEWMPAPIVARALYCVHFPPADGLSTSDLPNLGRKKAEEDE